MERPSCMYVHIYAAAELEELSSPLFQFPYLPSSDYEVMICMS